MKIYNFRSNTGFFFIALLLLQLFYIKNILLQNLLSIKIL